jgi:hypothetical protein
MAKKLTKAKAKKILKHGKVRGHKLTKKQKRFFGARAGGAPVKRKKATKRKKRRQDGKTLPDKNAGQDSKASKNVSNKKNARRTKETKTKTSRERKITMAPATETKETPTESKGLAAEAKERAEKGKEILKSQKAQGEPGTKQPAAKDNRAEVDDTLKKLSEMAPATKGKESSAKRAASPGKGNNPVPPEERTFSGPANAPAATAALATAASAISTARDQIASQLVADAKLTSDPRYERDQELYALQQQGKAGLIPPSEAEQAAAAARAGLTPEVAEKIPSDVDAQVADDMKRINEAKERAAAAVPSATTTKPESKK